MVFVTLSGFQTVVTFEKKSFYCLDSVKRGVCKFFFLYINSLSAVPKNLAPVALKQPWCGVGVDNLGTSAPSGTWHIGEGTGSKGTEDRAGDWAGSTEQKSEQNIG